MWNPVGLRDWGNPGARQAVRVVGVKNTHRLAPTPHRRPFYDRIRKDVTIAASAAQWHHRAGNHANHKYVALIFKQRRAHHQPEPHRWLFLLLGVGSHPRYPNRVRRVMNSLPPTRKHSASLWELLHLARTKMEFGVRARVTSGRLIIRRRQHRKK